MRRGSSSRYSSRFLPYSQSRVGHHGVHIEYCEQVPRDPTRRVSAPFGPPRKRWSDSSGGPPLHGRGVIHDERNGDPRPGYEYQPLRSGRAVVLLEAQVTAEVETRVEGAPDVHDSRPEVGRPGNGTEASERVRFPHLSDVHPVALGPEQHLDERDGFLLFFGLERSGKRSGPLLEDAVDLLTAGGAGGLRHGAPLASRRDAEAPARRRRARGPPRR